MPTTSAVATAAKLFRAVVTVTHPGEPSESEVLGPFVSAATARTAATRRAREATRWHTARPPRVDIDVQSAPIAWSSL